MLTEVTLPVLDQTGGDVTLLRWLKREGDAVRQGETLCEIETGKANVEIEANVTGILRQRLIAEGQAIPALTVLALIGDASAPLPKIDPFYRVVRAIPSAAPTSVAPSVPPPAREAASDTRQPAVSPRARKLAAEHGVDLATVIGSGPAGRIVEEDVMRALGLG